MVKACALIFSFLIFSSFNYTNASDSLLALFENKNTNELIIAINDQFGNNAALRDDKVAVISLLGSLEKKYKSDGKFYEYIKYFINTKEGIYEKDPIVKINYFKSKLKEYSNQNQREFKAIILHTIGIYSFVAEDYNQAFEFMIRANDLFKQVGYVNIPQIGLYLHDFALSNYTFKYYELSKDLMLHSIKLPVFSKNLDIQRFNTLALSYKNIDQWDSALFYFQKAREKAIQYNIPVWTALINENIGNCYSYRNQFDSAIFYYEKSYELIQGDSVNIDINLSIQLSLIKVLLKMGSINEAEKLLKPIIASDINIQNGSFYFSRTQLLEGSKLQYFETLKNYNFLIGNYKNSNMYADSLYALKETVHNKYQAQIIKLTEYKLQLAKNKLDIIEFKSNRKNNILIFILMGAALFISLLAFWMIRLKKKKNEILHQLKEKEFSYEIEMKQKELRLAKDELLGYIRHLTSKNEYIASISQELEIIKSNAFINPEDLSSDLNLLKEHRILTDEDWENFQTLFCKVNNVLFTQLKQYQPSLTNAELRYLLLVSLQLNKKEIANMLGISPDSLRVTWNRLKKKLPLKYESSPELFIEEIQDCKISFL